MGSAAPADPSDNRSEVADEFRRALESVVRVLVSHPEDVAITYQSSRSLLCFEVRTHPKDVGRLVGHQGATADMLRSLFGKAASRAGWGRCVIDVPQAPPVSPRSGRSKNVE